MSIVVFDPHTVEDVDFADRMRHPSMQDPSGGMWLSDTEPSFIDTNALRKGRLAKLRAWMAKANYGAIILFDPYNQRYATGSRNMFGYFLRNSTRYFFIPTEGPVILFEYPQSYHVSTVLDTVDEARPSKLVWSSVSHSVGWPHGLGRPRGSPTSTPRFVRRARARSACPVRCVRSPKTPPATSRSRSAT